MAKFLIVLFVALLIASAQGCVDEKVALEALGYTQQLWDAIEGTVDAPEDAEYGKENWAAMSADAQQAATQVGFSETSWNDEKGEDENGVVPAIKDKYWADLTTCDECVCDDSWDTAPCHSWITDPSRDCGFYYASNGQCEELGEGCVTQGGDGTAAPAVVEIAFVVSFTEEVGLIDEIRACNALVTDIAALDGIDEDYFECGMTLSDGSLSFVYNTEIVITIPATALAMSEGVTMVEDLQATVADTRALTDVVSTSLETALPNNVGTVTSKLVMKPPPSEAKSCVDEKVALEALGFTKKIWDDDEDALGNAPPVPEDAEFLNDWADMSADSQQAATQVGYSETSWNDEDGEDENGVTPAIGNKYWADLTTCEGDLDEACSKVDGCKTGLSCKLYDATGVARRLRRGLMFTKGSSKMRCTADAGTD